MHSECQHVFRDYGSWRDETAPASYAYRHAEGGTSPSGFWERAHFMYFGNIELIIILMVLIKHNARVVIFSFSFVILF
jgi:hypothetical protein